MSLVTNTQILNYLQVAANVTVPAAGQTFITMVQPFVEGAIKKLLGYNVESATYTEFYPEALANGYFDGDDIVTAGYDLVGGVVIPRARASREFAALVLKELPLRSITSLYENPGAWSVAGGDWPSGSLLPANAYYIDGYMSGMSKTGIVRRVSGTWSRIPRTIKVTYTAGYSSADIDTYFPTVRMAALISIADAYLKAIQRSRFGKLGGPIASVSVEDFSVSYQQFVSASNFLPPEAMSLLMQEVAPQRYFGF